MFDDIRKCTYERLSKIVHTQYPYKHSNNAYPLGDRRYSSRHFRKHEDGTFSLWYVDRETADNLHGTINGKHKRVGEHPESYAKRLLAIVHPDNSIEFTSPAIGIGESSLLSQATDGWVYNCKAKGGLMFQRTMNASGAMVVHPVFKGLRISLDTYQPVTPYKMFSYKLKHKVAKEVMGRYAEFISVFETMINAMDDRSIWQVYVDLYNEEAGALVTEWHTIGFDKVRELIDKKYYVDAGCLLTMLHSNSNMRWRTIWTRDQDAQHDVPAKASIPSDDSLSSSFKSKAVADVKTKLRKTILPTHEESFDETELEIGKHVPASTWGLRIEVDGAPVVRL